MLPQGTNAPATLRIWLATGLALLAAILGFALLIRADLQRPRPFDPAACTEAVPKDLVWACTPRAQADYYTLDGYAFVPGEHLEAVENYIVLKNTSRGGVPALSHRYGSAGRSYRRRPGRVELQLWGIHCLCARFGAGGPARAV